MKKLSVLIISLTSASVFADVVVPMNLVDEKVVSASVGQITVSES